MPERVLRRSPLTNVVCEVRFEAAPAAQSRVLGLSRALEQVGLTDYAAEQGFQVAVRPGQIEQTPVHRHRFAAPDGSASLTLDVNAFAFETAAYVGVDPFLEAWRPIAEAVGQALGLEARTRIGLRYVNEIVLAGGAREAVQFAVNPELLPPWGGHPNLEALSHSLHELRFAQEEGELAFRHGLQRPPGAASPVYLLDYDYYEQRLRAFDVANDAERLRRFNAIVTDVFYWSITNEQYKAFDPEERPDA